MKKKGFTLIELLAVIIVIAVITIITVPTILGVIDKSKKAAYKDSIYGIIDSAKIYLAMNQENIKPTEEIEFVCNGIACFREDNGDKLSFKGTVPKSGSIYLQADGNVLVESVYNGKYYANNETGEVVITDNDTTLTRGELTKLVKDLQAQNKAQQDEINSLKDKDIAFQNQISNLQANTTSIDKVYPVGSIYISTSNVDPGDLFKGTEWERYAENRTLVGTSTTSGQTGGNSSITLTEGQLPSHKHAFKPAGTVNSTFTGTATTSASTGSGYSIGYTSSSRTTSSAGAHTHTTLININSIMATWQKDHPGSYSSSYYVSNGGNTATGSAGAHTHTVSDYYANSITGVQAHTHSVTATGTVNSTFTGTDSDTGNTGSSSAINIMNPYITVYMWKRVS